MCACSTSRSSRCLAITIGTAGAHDPGLSSANVTVSDATIDAVITFNERDLETLPDFSQAQPIRSAAELLHIRSGNVLLPIESAEFETAPPNNVIIKMRWARSGAAVLSISSGVIDQLPFGHRQLLSVRTVNGANLGDRLLSARENKAFSRSSRLE